MTSFSLPESFLVDQRTQGGCPGENIERDAGTDGEERQSALSNAQRLVLDIYQKCGCEPLRHTSAGRSSESAPCRRDSPRVRDLQKKQ
jgi:hypothetical protein